jgi:hypothetical protein
VPFPYSIAILNDSDKFVGVVPRVPTPYLSGSSLGKSPYNNYANDLGLLHYFWVGKRHVQSPRLSFRRSQN